MPPDGLTGGRAGSSSRISISDLLNDDAADGPDGRWKPKPAWNALPAETITPRTTAESTLATSPSPSATIDAASEHTFSPTTGEEFAQDDGTTSTDSTLLPNLSNDTDTPTPSDAPPPPPELLSRLSGDASPQATVSAPPVKPDLDLIRRYFDTCPSFPGETIFRPHLWSNIDSAPLILRLALSAEAARYVLPALPLEVCWSFYRPARAIAFGMSDPPSVELVQALLKLGHVATGLGDMKAMSAFTGMGIRMAMLLRLDREEVGDFGEDGLRRLEIGDGGKKGGVVPEAARWGGTSPKRENSKAAGQRMADKEEARRAAYERFVKREAMRRLWRICIITDRLVAIVTNNKLLPMISAVGTDWDRRWLKPGPGCTEALMAHVIEIMHSIQSHVCVPFASIQDVELRQPDFDQLELELDDWVAWLPHSDLTADRPCVRWFWHYQDYADALNNGSGDIGFVEPDDGMDDDTAPFPTSIPPRLGSNSTSAHRSLPLHTVPADFSDIPPCHSAPLPPPPPYIAASSPWTILCTYLYHHTSRLLLHRPRLLCLSDALRTPNSRTAKAERLLARSLDACSTSARAVALVSAAVVGTSGMARLTQSTAGFCIMMSSIALEAVAQCEGFYGDPPTPRQDGGEGLGLEETRRLMRANLELVRSMKWYWAVAGMWEVTIVEMLRGLRGGEQEGGGEGVKGEEGVVAPSQKFAKFNEHCGGFTVSALPCANGLTCVLNVSMPDVGGKCQKLAKVGGACGGNLAEPYSCPSGLTCVRESHGGYMPVDQLMQKDIGGTCLKLAQTNESCGGNMVTAPVCQTGLLCKPRQGQRLPVAEIGGVCLSDL
ncbi:hypothetical protein HK101_002126 [Irineochytrium annulatum]|nr:hypothetical protein HK101_002126 [Irineochytrium annulatum]